MRTPRSGPGARPGQPRHSRSAAAARMSNSRSSGRRTARGLLDLVRRVNRRRAAAQFDQTLVFVGDSENRLEDTRVEAASLGSARSSGGVVRVTTLGSVRAVQRTGAVSRVTELRFEIAPPNAARKPPASTASKCSLFGCCAPGARGRSESQDCGREIHRRSQARRANADPHRRPPNANRREPWATSPHVDSSSSAQMEDARWGSAPKRRERATRVAESARN